MQAVETPPPVETERRQRPGLLRWLLLAPLLLLLTFLCAALATRRAAGPASVGTSSLLTADYEPWSALVFAPVQLDILGEIARDLGLAGVPEVVHVGGCFLPFGDCGTPTAETTATPTGPGGTQIAWGGGPSRTPTAGAGGGQPGPGGSATLPPTRTRTPGPAASPTASRTATATPSSTATFTPSSTATFTPSPTATFTASPTSTFTPSPTSSSTPTATPTQLPYTIVAPAGEPEEGPPDGEIAAIRPGNALLIELSLPIIVNGDSDPDLVYYEQRAASSAWAIYVDWVIVHIGQSPNGEWFVVLDWGHGGPDENTAVGTYGEDGEDPNEGIPITPAPGATPLVGPTLPPSPGASTGIEIDVDSAPSAPPTGEYYYLLIAGPTDVPNPWDSGNWAEVDAIEVLPTPTP